MPLMSIGFKDAQPLESALWTRLNLADNSCNNEKCQGKMFLLVHLVFLSHFMPPVGTFSAFFLVPVP